MTSALLEIAGVAKFFGGIRAVDDVSLTILRGEFVGLIGPNGSGKTTLVHCLTGALVPDAGSVRFDGREITGMAPFRVSRAGITRTFQNLEDFPDLSVLDHLLLATQRQRPSAGRTVDDAAARRVLDELALGSAARQVAGELSYGQRKLLGMAMAIMQQSQLLVLDEPTAGVNPVLIDTIAERLSGLAASGQTIILIEHNIPLVMRLATRLVVMSSGKVIADGTPAEVRRSESVREAYFGR